MSGDHVMLSARNVTWNAGTLPILRETSLTVNRGETLGLVGPNGSGKSTLLRLLGGLRNSASGEVFLAEAPLSTLSRKAIARQIALVEQQAETTDSIRVRDAVALGRTPYLGALSPWSECDGRIVDEVLRQVDMADKADRLWHTLSGGERQRVHIARALAQKPQVLLLDEPTNHLDVRHQIAILSLVRALPLTSVLVLHDLNLAAMFCDRLAVMSEGRIVADGPVDEVLTSNLIWNVFGIEAEIHHDREAGTRNVLFRNAVR